ncbi:MAG: M1 family metallopeptidase [Cyclobacteriaceae bacterium]
MKKFLFLLSVMAMAMPSLAQDKWDQKFEQLGTTLRTPNTYRTAAGSPGKEYWQQKADYKINIVLDEENKRVTGEETITYLNNSPDPLTYLWIQLDQNIRADNSMSSSTSTKQIRNQKINIKQYKSLVDDPEYRGGFNISWVRTQDNIPLNYVINNTMMRVDLPKTLASGETFSLKIAWSFLVNDRAIDGGRSGYEYFPEDDNYLFTVAQFFPRMAVYTDYDGWQNKQFLGNGEFTLNFGDYEVDITVPSDYVIAATGVLQNQKENLTSKQISQLEKAKTTFDKPVMIITEEEAIKNESSRSKTTKTWRYKAKNVRDFAFAASRKFIWDAQAVKQSDGSTPLAMSFYPKEGNPLWEEESTKAIVNTIKTYSKYTIDYPYPVAISVHTASIGMEYPMICFNYGRPEKDGTIPDRTKYGMIGVVIHEVGHNYFPMIINSDERQWTWMDEGINTYLEYRTELENYPDYPYDRGPAESIIPYMSGAKGAMRPIMTNAEQVLQGGNNAYGKPAAAYNILREHIMGPELFDFALKTYAQRWAFKHPTPADFFRTMEDASAIDLDWFWKGWFYTTDNVDVAVKNLTWYKVTEESLDPEFNVDAQEPTTNAPLTSPKTLAYQEMTDRLYREFRSRLDEETLFDDLKSKNIYELELENVGGLVTPIFLEWSYTDGSQETEYIPAEVWRKNEQQVLKYFFKDKVVASVRIDPNNVTADTEKENNTFPPVDVKSRFEKFKENKND